MTDGMPPADLYLAFEGIDGSGKSVVSRAIVEMLRESGIEAAHFACLARGEHTLGRFLRRTFYVEPLPLRARILNAIPAAKLLLFQRNAVANWRTEVSSNEPSVFIGDRSIASLLINFGSAFGNRAATEVAIRWMNTLPLPADILYLDVTPETATRRLEARGLALDLNETPAGLTASRQLYEEIIFRHPLWYRPRIHRIDAELPLPDVVAAAHQCVTKLIERGSPYVVGLIAEKQGFSLSMSESSNGELRHKEEVLQSESSDCDMATELSEVVLVGLADLLDDAVKTKSLEKT
jgi:thymidylate kinase